MLRLTIGVLALQGAFVEHVALLRKAAAALCTEHSQVSFSVGEVRTAVELAGCDALVIPGGESTSISLVAERSGLLAPLREFVKAEGKPVWGTCAGMILLAESANRSKGGGQQLIGGLDVRVQRNYFGRQVESFEAELDLPFLRGGPRFHSVFIRAPVVEEILPLSPSSAPQREHEGLLGTAFTPPRAAAKARVEVLGRLPGRAKTLQDKTVTAKELGEDGDIVAVRQGNVFATAFHPELTGDARIHVWWLREVLGAQNGESKVEEQR